MTNRSLRHPNNHFVLTEQYISKMCSMLLPFHFYSTRDSHISIPLAPTLAIPTPISNEIKTECFASRKSHSHP